MEVQSPQRRRCFLYLLAGVHDMSDLPCKLYYGDCLTIFREHLKNASVDLIYLDPPFNSNQDYNAIYKDETGRPLPDQIEAFCDTWTLDEERERAIRTMPVLMRSEGIDDDVTQFWEHWTKALRNTNPRLLAYLSYMVERLIWMKRILKPTGSLYLHCDLTASHYIKVMLDAIFEHSNFRNEIIWRRTGSHNSTRSYGSIHDTILFYSASDKYKFNIQKRPYARKHVEKRYTVDGTGKPKQITGGNIMTGAGVSGGESGESWRGFDPSAKNRHWAIPTFLKNQLPDSLVNAGILKKLDALYDMGLIEIKEGAAWPHPVRYLKESDGLPYQDIWAHQPYTEGILYGTDEGIDEDVKWLGPTSPERLGFKTQKPCGLIERIISVSSSEGDVVLDPFCGCATTIEAAHRLNRKWIGIDIAIHAIRRVAAVRLSEKLGLVEDRDYTIEGVPRNVEGAEQLWERDKYHFQKWAVEQCDGFVTNRRSADGGIDGRIYFDGNHPDNLESMILEVKGGKSVSQNDLRGLRGALADSGALMGGLIILHPLGPTKERNFKREMARAGRISIRGREFPKMQLMTVEELIEGKRFDTPPVLGRYQTPQQQLVF